MEIIPVIDLMGGIVVHAKAGLRDQYVAIESALTDSADLYDVVTAMCHFFPFKTIYIADLDAISGESLYLAQYQQLTERFPDITFWVDAGVKNRADWIGLSAIAGLCPILASESLQDIALLEADRNGVLSLDFKQGQFLGDERLWEGTSCWPNQVIVMNLDYVGVNQGPDLTLLQKVRSKGNAVGIIAAGGVRNVADLTMLENEGIKAVLVASALHDGRLRHHDLKIFT